MKGVERNCYIDMLQKFFCKIINNNVRNVITQTEPIKLYNHYQKKLTALTLPSTHCLFRFLQMYSSLVQFLFGQIIQTTAVC